MLLVRNLGETRSLQRSDTSYFPLRLSVNEQEFIFCPLPCSAG